MNWKRLERQLTERALEEFVSGSAFPKGAGDAQGVWRPQIALGRWRVETDAASHAARARNVESGLQIQADEGALYFALKAFLKGRDERPAPDEIGLALAGGGAKGAYQVGVWRALCETGLAARVSGVSGASIGAINAPLFLLGDWREACELWLSMSAPEVRRAQRGEIERMTRAYEKRLNGSPLPPEVLDFLADIFITQPELERRLLPVIKRLSPDTRRKSAIFSAVTPIEETFLLLPGLLDPQAPPVIDEIAAPDAHYISWRGLSNMDIVRLLLASSAIPIFYNPVDFRGKMYYDGGLYDNVPIWPLYEAGFRKFVVVDLKRERLKPWRMPYGAEPCEFCVIRPGAAFADDAIATFELTPDITKERIRQGYRDALRALEGFA